MTFAQKTERTRGPKLAVFITSDNGVPMEEALRKADEAGLVIASNKRLSQALFARRGRKSIIDAFPCWSGTMTAYVEPGQKLGKQVEYVDPETGHRWVFAVPESHREKKNAILVAEHPDYSLEVDGNNRVIHAKTVDLVEMFPASRGWYTGDSKHDIPTGKEIEPCDTARYLWRIDKRVGPVFRAFRDGYSDRWGVRLAIPPSLDLAVAVESPRSDTKLKMREENGRCIVEGTPEQIAAAVRLLEQIK